MARPLKEGLDYFPLDVNLDDKINALESVFKNDGLVWIIKFWQSAYKTMDGEVSLDNYSGVIHAENSRVTLEKQLEIIKLCLEIKLLIKLDNGKYTSNGIKKRLEYVVGERERRRFKHKVGVIPPIIHGENQEETGESKGKESKVKKRRYSTPKVSDQQFIDSLKTNPAYKGVDIDRELGKMDAWLATRQGRKKTQKFILSWLNRIDPVLESTPQKPISVADPMFIKRE